MFKYKCVFGHVSTNIVELNIDGLWPLSCLREIEHLLFVWDQVGIFPYTKSLKIFMSWPMVRFYLEFM